MAEKITKDLNPSYGSIQALKTRDTDVVTFCEDKVLKVTSQKDALFNADGNAQLLASNRVLGTAVPFGGDYGISQNPESLSWDNFRIYFTDKQRQAVLRLSGNGITPISNVGMKTWFRDNMEGNMSLLGTFDAVNGEYNLTLSGSRDRTISFNEGSKGWVSFKSFIPQEGVSVGGKYITAVKNKIWLHESKSAGRNTFYNTFRSSTLDVLFNDMPGSVKTFRTINYEGSQAYIRSFETINELDPDGVTQVPNTNGDGEYYNIGNSVGGWSVTDIDTDQSYAGEAEFRNKEGKWFSRINGDERTSFIQNGDLNEFSVQGIGFTYEPPLPPDPTDEEVEDNNAISVDEFPTNINIQITGDSTNNDTD